VQRFYLGVEFLREIPELQTKQKDGKPQLTFDPTKLSFGFQGFTGKELIELLAEQGFTTTPHDGDYATFHFTHPLSDEDIEKDCNSVKRALTSQNAKLKHAGEHPSVNFDEFYPDRFDRLFDRTGIVLLVLLDVVDIDDRYAVGYVERTDSAGNEGLLAFECASIGKIAYAGDFPSGFQS
jgi:hypothetical protein